MASFLFLNASYTKKHPVLTRTICVRRHRSDPDSQDNWPSDRTLFVSHLDAFVCEKALVKYFNQLLGDGAVEDVMIKRVEKAGKGSEPISTVTYARVRLISAAMLDKVFDPRVSKSICHLPLASAQSLLQTINRDLVDAERKESSSVPKLRSSANCFVDADVLSAYCDQYMLHYVEAKRKAAEWVVVDEDGFQKVVAGSNKAADGTVIKSIDKTNAIKRKGVEPQQDFYKFQRRERKREEWATDRRMRLEDMKIVNEMKQASAFRV